MYPTGTEEVTFPSEERDLTALREAVEPMLGPLNTPLGWWFSGPDEDPGFELVIWMPRKMKTWSVRITEFDRTEVEEWLDTTIRSAVEAWFGWSPK